jgi:hypothetical protein
MSKIRNLRVYLLAIIISLGVASSWLPLTAAATPDGPLLTILNHTSVVDFGRRKIGVAGQAETITVANSGTSNLEIRRVGLVGDNPADFSLANDNCSNRVLVPDGICTVTLNFAPVTPGDRSARLSIENNAVGSEHLIPLTGFGVDAAMVTREVGPIDVQYGFPLWYQDDSGQRLTLCLDASGYCIAPLPDPFAPPSVKDGNINFPGETFWWYAQSDITRAIGGRATLTLTKEAAFTTDGQPNVGQQLSFDRLRVRVDKLTPGKSYKITHPFGTLNLVADSKGYINFTDNIGCKGVPCDFRSSLNGRVGVFLRWDASVAPAAPAGYLGDPVVQHKITGSPLGTNFFRVEGPNAGGQGVNLIQTDLFLVQGKIF